MDVDSLDSRQQIDMTLDPALRHSRLLSRDSESLLISLTFLLPQELGYRL